MAVGLGCRLTLGDPQNTHPVSIASLNITLRTDTPTGSPQTPATPSPGSSLDSWTFDRMFAKIVAYSARRPGHHDHDLNFDWMNLTEVVYGALPEDLKELSLCHNPLLEIDCALLPKTLEVLDLKHCRSLERILNLDQLPKLMVLEIEDTAITSLSKLPTSLFHLNASHTRLTALPALMKCGDLRRIDLEWCKEISKLPMLPEGIHTLCLRHSGIDELPVLPETLVYLDVDHAEVVRQGLAPERPDDVSHVEYTKTTRAWHAACLRLERYEALHEELMMAAWHPDRVAKWLNHGEEVLDNLMGC